MVVYTVGSSGGGGGVSRFLRAHQCN